MYRRKKGWKYEGGRVQETQTNAQFYHSQENAEFPKASKIGKRGPTTSSRNPRVLRQKARIAEQREKSGRQVMENFLYRWAQHTEIFFYIHN